MTDLLTTKEPITLEQLREKFLEDEFTSLPIRDPSEYNEKELWLYNRVLKFFNEEWRENGKFLGLKHPSSCYTKDFPPELLRKRTQRIVADLVVRLWNDKKALVKVIFQIIIPLFIFKRMYPDKCLHNTMNALMKTIDVETIAEVSKKHSCDEDFSSKPLNYPRLDHRRKWYHSRSKIQMLPLEDDEAPNNDSEKNPETAIDAKLMVEYLRAQVSEQENKIIDLMLKEFTQQEISEELGIAQSTVSKKISKFRKILKNPE